VVLLFLIDKETVLYHQLCQVHESLELQVLSSLGICFGHGCSDILEEHYGYRCDNQPEYASVCQIHIIQDSDETEETLIGSRSEVFLGVAQAVLHVVQDALRVGQEGVEYQEYHGQREYGREGQEETGDVQVHEGKESNLVEEYQRQGDKHESIPCTDDLDEKHRPSIHITSVNLSRVLLI